MTSSGPFLTKSPAILHQALTCVVLMLLWSSNVTTLSQARGTAVLPFPSVFLHMWSKVCWTIDIIILLMIYVIWCASPTRRNRCYESNIWLLSHYVFSWVFLKIWIKELAHKLFPKYGIEFEGPISKIICYQEFIPFFGWSDKTLSSNTALLQSYDFVELWAGAGMASGMVQRSGRATAALDIAYFEKDPTKPERSNYFDILTPSGFGPHCSAK